MFNINYLALFVAAIAAFAVGAIWFGPKTFFPVWWKLQGRKPEDAAGSGNVGLMFGLTFVAQFAMGFAVALVLKLEELAGVAVNVGTGLQVGLLLGVFVAAAASLSHRLFAGHGYRVWLLEVGNDIAAVVVMGLILGAWR
jgi:hypothetical protein